MSQLVATQDAFQRYVLDGADAIAASIAGGEGIDPQRRLRIYYDAYRLRLIEALATDYEAVKALLGEDGFDSACRGYIESTPSTFRNVRWYGADLHAYLRDTAPWSEQPVAHELALFEWTLTLAFDAPDDPVVQFEELTQLPPEAWSTVAFALHPCAHVIDLQTNAPSFRKAHDAGEPLPEPTAADSAQPWLIWRNDYTVCFRSLGDFEAWAIRTSQEGATFTALCEGLCDWVEPDQAAPQAAQLLRQWVNDGLITAAVINPSVIGDQ